MRKRLHKLLKLLKSRRARQIYAGIFAVFLLANVLTFAVYRGRTYPNTVIAGRKAGNLDATGLEAYIRKEEYVPKQVELVYKGKKITVKRTDMGVSVNQQATKQKVTESRKWLPLQNFVSQHSITPQSVVNEQVLQKYLEAFAKANEQPAKNAELQLVNNQFDIKAEKPGHTLDINRAIELIKTSALSGKPTNVPAKSVNAEVTKAGLSGELSKLQKQQATPVTLRFGSKTKTFSSAEVAGFYTVEPARGVLSDTKIITAINKANFGIRIGNLTEAVNNIKSSLLANKPLDFTLTEAPAIVRSYSYCIAARGGTDAYLDGLASKLAAVFGDPRGWGLDGRVSFVRATSGCNFTVWLTDASQMATFGSICDSDWSCRVGQNVVINFNRWQGASTAWNAAGGSLDDYRSMVINHEVGHWFEFNHKNCGGPGQAAPVMQQQSIDLQGCTFNPWPLASELQVLKNSFGI